MKIHIAAEDILTRLLARHKRHRGIMPAVDLSVVLREVLNWANRLVPSESGSILLDDPEIKIRGRREGRLYLAASFGRKSSSLVGTSVADHAGIAGESYRAGKAYISRDVRRDLKFYDKIDERIRFTTRSIICAPINIDEAVVGVIELINKKDGGRFNREDLELLKIFAGYTATLIKNALIGRDVEEESRHDNLTGLYNERFLYFSLESEVGRAGREGGDVSLIFFDLDRLKEVNDRYGHLAGSTVLKEVGDILRRIFQGTNAVLARYGGDEYVAILPDRGLQESIPYAEKIREGIASNTFLRRPVPGGSRALNIRGVITCSVGVSSFLQNGLQGKNVRKNVRKNAEALIKSADSAMYAAKEAGKNRVAVAGQP